MRHLIRSSRYALLAVVLACGQSDGPDISDNFQWLESMHGDSAMAWVQTENARTATVLEADPRYASIYKAALDMAQAEDRLPYVSFLGGELYNFWQDSAHVRGIWRRTTLASYRSASPAWTTVLDIDSLARAENANWVWQGSDCARPGERRCLLMLSDGGEDANTVREFDVVSRTFVTDGFVLPKGKQRLAWVSLDTILVSREWEAGEVTTSGYPFIVKRLARGQALADAVEIYRGSATDGGYGVSPATLVDAKGNRATFIDRPLSTFESEKHLVRATDVAQLSIPRKAGIVDMVDGRVLVQLSAEWTGGAAPIPAGAVAAFDLAAALREPGTLVPEVVFAPGPRESVAGVSATRDRLLLSIYQNVRGTVLVASRAADGTWTRTPLPLPDNVSTGVIDTDITGNQALVSVTGFLTPSSVWLADASAATAAEIKTMAPRFDATRSVVEQREATSKDGTKVPYFIVHPQGMVRDGSNPTILYAYGGFEASMTPRYDADVGKLWLEQGGVYVMANIRGGGEFGPAWHEAGLKTKRQVIYDDFAAVAEDLIATEVTSPRRLGIQGGSNGGLLMGVQFTQRPDLWNAVDIQVPLLDMLRFEQIQAGASWVGEYGSVSVPEERAFLASISPYHNLRAWTKYPEPLIWTTTKDDRVGPQHARKFAAKMSAMGLPYLFHEVIEGGHGAGANAAQQAHTTALEFTYFARQLMDPEKQFVP
ncbi:MAG: S9 family peptidase [Gemmatimonadaceae bacterium]|nr:S9 family peptidase [Gemmatimonadaceae bacterium]